MRFIEALCYGVAVVGGKGKEYFLNKLGFLKKLTYICKNLKIMLQPITEIHNSNGTVWHPKADYYFADENGRIWSEKSHRWLSERTNKVGYKTVGLMVEEQKTQKWFLVHRLVYEVFIGQIHTDLQVNHINENKTDNRLCNLELLTPKENCNFGTRNERAAKARSNHPQMSKQVYQYTLDGQLVAIWPSSRECQRNGFDHGHVTACCRGESKSHKGFKWAYR